MFLLGVGKWDRSFYFIKWDYKSKVNKLFNIYFVSFNLGNKLYYIYEKIILNMGRIGINIVLVYSELWRYYVYFVTELREDICFLKFC